LALGVSKRAQTLEPTWLTTGLDREI